MIGLIRKYGQNTATDCFGIVALEAHQGTNGRSPRLIVRIKQNGGETTWMPEHDDLFAMIEFYRRNDREWDKLKRLLEDAIAGRRPVWDARRYV